MGKFDTIQEQNERQREFAGFVSVISEQGHIAASSPIRGTKPRRYMVERTCPTCSIKLSTYNKGPFCYRHTVPKPIRVRGRNVA